MALDIKKMMAKPDGSDGPDWIKDKKLIQMFQTRVNHEEYNNRVYLAMYQWAAINGWIGVAKFLKAQAEGETSHSVAFATFLSDLNVQPVVDALPKPPKQEFTSLKELFLAVMETELKTTEEINAMWFHALSVQDAVVLQVLNTYLTEQIEEVSVVRTALDFIELAKDNPAALLEIDERIGNLV